MTMSPQFFKKSSKYMTKIPSKNRETNSLWLHKIRWKQLLMSAKYTVKTTINVQRKYNAHNLYDSRKSGEDNSLW